LEDRRGTSKGVVDTSVLVAGIAGFKSQIGTLRNPSARLLRDWSKAELGSRAWVFCLLVSAEILQDKEVVERLGVRRNLIVSSTSCGKKQSSLRRRR
jgi:hypothetical protein